MRLPDIRLEVLEDLSPPSGQGFLVVVRRRLRAHYPDGSSSEPFVYDEVDRPALNAAVIVAHYADEHGVRQVFLRSALRPPLAFRDAARPATADFPDGGLLWELPAGLVEPSEESGDGAREAARRELAEELGFDVELERIVSLGTGVYPVPGFCAERQSYFEVEVTPGARREPELDGSALERGGLIAALPLATALERCRSGELRDAKTELGLRRFHERLSESPPR